MKQKLIFTNQGEDEELEYQVSTKDQRRLEITLNGNSYLFDFLYQSEDEIFFEFDGRIEKISIAQYSVGKFMSVVQGEDLFFQIPSGSTRRKRGKKEGSMMSPMPGKILKILVNEGAKVKKGDALLILEAMKMEHTIKATRDGSVDVIIYKQGDQVDGGVELVTLKT